LLDYILILVANACTVDVYVLAVGTRLSSPPQVRDCLCKTSLITRQNRGQKSSHTPILHL